MDEGGPPPPDDGGMADPQVPEPQMPGRRMPAAHRAVVVAAATLVVIGAIGAYLVHLAGGYYALEPGDAPFVTADAGCRPSGYNLALPDGRPCVRLVVPAGRAHSLSGSIMMVDVLEGQASVGDYLLSKLGLLKTFRDGTVLEPASSIRGSEPASLYDCQNVQLMEASTTDAPVAALRRLGYKVREVDLGAQIEGVLAGTPAAAAGLRCNDLVVAADGHAVHTYQDLVTQIHALSPGGTLHLTVRRAGTGGKQVTLQLAARLVGTPANGSQRAAPTKPFLGIADTQTRMDFALPYPVSVDVGAIGGPSAGLALTLGLLDVLSNGQLTGGHAVAATGTIDANGNVGPVGDVAQKAVAVRRAGAQVFFVPNDPVEIKAAKSEAGSMKVYAVSNLQQALDILESLGGRIPPPVPNQNGAA